MPLKTSFANVLRAIRCKRNITQRAFANAASRTYLSKLEAGKSSITLDKLEQISNRLELSPLTLLALVLSEDRGQSASDLIIELNKDIQELQRDGGMPGLHASWSDEARADTAHEPKTKRVQPIVDGTNPGAIQAELPFTESYP